MMPGAVPAFPEPPDGPVGPFRGGTVELLGSGGGPISLGDGGSSLGQGVVRQQELDPALEALEKRRRFFESSSPGTELPGG